MSTKHTLEECCAIAESRGGKCLSKVYKNTKTPMLWECSEGHQWRTGAGHIFRGSWCAKCSGHAPLDIEECIEYAKKKGGKCLSKKYKNLKTLMDWECENEHKFKMTFDNIKHKNQWCPKCRRLTFEEAKEYAESKGGVILSTEMIDGSTPLEFQCKDGHIFTGEFRRMKFNQSWCRKCATNDSKLKIEDCHLWAAKKNGKCLDSIYVTIFTLMRWLCENNHEFKMSFNNVKHGHWCAYCFGNAPLTIEICHELASKKGGKCLDKIYINVCTKMNWQCGKEHEFKMTVNDIKYNNSWCPVCASSQSERVCKEFLEKLTGKNFQKVRPKWLKLPDSDNALEIDGYCKELNLAFEYNGIQHYEHIPFFHPTLEDFEKQKERDRCKREILERKKINLMIIPYWYNYYNEFDLKCFLASKLFKYFVPENILLADEIIIGYTKRCIISEKFDVRAFTIYAIDGDATIKKSESESESELEYLMYLPRFECDSYARIKSIVTDLLMEIC